MNTPTRNGDTFLRITNRDVYNKLESLEQKMDMIINKNTKMSGSIDTLWYAVLGAIGIASWAVFWLWSHVTK